MERKQGEDNIDNNQTLFKSNTMVIESLSKYKEINSFNKVVKYKPIIN